MVSLYFVGKMVIIIVGNEIWEEKGKEERGKGNRLVIVGVVVVVVEDGKMVVVEVMVEMELVLVFVVVVWFDMRVVVLRVMSLEEVKCILLSWGGCWVGLGWVWVWVFRGIKRIFLSKKRLGIFIIDIEWVKMLRKKRID